MVQYTRFPPKVRRTAPQPPEQGGEGTALPVAASDALPHSDTLPSTLSDTGSTSSKTPRATAGSGSTLPTHPLSEVTNKVTALSVVVVMLMISIVIPIYFKVGTLRLSPSRLVLLAMCLPVLFYWASGRAGRIRPADILVLLYSVWVAIAIFTTEGIAHIEFIGITVIEIFCPYLLARCYIRSEKQYAALINILSIIALLLAPAAILEAATGFRLYTKIFDPLFSVLPALNDEKRLGMTRAQTVFEHPILYGIYISLFFSPVYLAARAAQKSAFKSLLIASPIIVANFFSLSSGAYLGLAVQLLLIGWGYAMHRSPKRWQILIALVVLAFVIVNLISNRTPFEVFITYLTFNSGNAYWRVLIFTYGIENVWAHPLFGLGLADWARPAWMHTSSVDNFWLLSAMRYGIPAFLLIVATYATVIVAIVSSRPASPSAQQHKLGLVFALIGLAIALCTVHLWNNTAVFMFFMMGAGGWFADVERGAEKDGQESHGQRDGAGRAAISQPQHTLRAGGPTYGQTFVSQATKGLGQTRSGVRQRSQKSV
jgi:O-antigen ligase